MPDNEAAYWSTIETARAIRTKQVSATELLHAAVRRIERLDGPINAVVRMDLDRASACAAEADDAVVRGDHLGPLHGVPITIKDSFQTAGLITTSGAPVLADYVPPTDADPVARYRAAGANIFAKTNLPLFAGDVQSYNEVYGTCSNPWNVEFSPGGSSGGSAASLAAGFSPLELGSDIAGSIRNPAAMSGICGHKPSYGVVSSRGQIPGMPGSLTQADIAVCGPMARTVDDLALALDLLVGPDAWHEPAYRIALPPARHERPRDYKVAAWLDDPGCSIGSEVGRLLDEAATALESAGVFVDREARPAIPFDKGVATFDQLLGGALCGGWSVQEIEEMATRSRLDGGLGVSHASQRHRAWLSANERRLQHRARWREFFEHWDAILLPVSPRAAIRHDHSEPMTRRTIDVDGVSRPYVDQMTWMGLTGVVYLPATVVPVGVTRDEGLPVGIQIAGPFLEDKTCLAVARLVEAALGGFRRPPGF
jgi:amidase